MKKFLRTVIFIIGHPFLPLFWLMLVAATGFFNFKEFYASYLEHYKSNEPFGVFDDF